MPQVPGEPYEPFPTVAPAERVLRPGGVPTVPDAFGVGVARAVSTFGGDVEQAGSEVFKRALALRQLDIDGQVRDQTTALMNAQSDKELNFLTARGNNADQAAMDAHLADLENLHQQHRKQLADSGVGPYGLNRFDDEYASMQRSFTRTAIGHSRQEIQKGQLSSIDTQNSAVANRVAMAPGDEDVWNGAVKSYKENGLTAGDMLGHGSDVVDYDTRQSVSKLALARVTGMALKDANGTGAAFDLLERLKEGGGIDGKPALSEQEDIDKAEKVVRQRFDRASNAAIKSREQDLLDEVKTYGSADTPRAKQIQGEIDSLRSRRVALGETQEESDYAKKGLQQDIDAAGTVYKVNTELRGTSPFQPMIDTAAARHGINPVLLARQLHQESGLNPNVGTSSAGAQGVAQFMPDTARQYGVDVRSPASSIEGAAHYMEDLTRQFNGNTGLALAAYNWGPGSVAAWMAAGANPRAMPEETRNYVKAISGQSVQDWTAGKRPDIASLDAPSLAAGGVQRALSVVNDPSLSSVQRDAGVKAIKEWRETNITLAHQAEEKQKTIDDSFRDSVMKDSRSERPQMTEQSIINLPSAAEGGPSAVAKETMIRWLRAEGMPGPSPRESQSNAIDLFKRINLPPGDPQKITNIKTIDDALGTLINKADHEWLDKKFNDPTTVGGERLSRVRTELSRAVGAILDKSVLGAVDQSGKLQSYRWERDLDDAIDNYRNVLKKDPMDLLTVGKPEFFGSDAKLQGYQVPIEQSIKNLQGRITGGGALPSPTAPTVTAAPGIPGVTPAFGKPAPSPQAPAQQPRRPGETFFQYMQRVGGAT